MKEGDWERGASMSQERNHREEQQYICQRRKRNMNNLWIGTMTCKKKNHNQKLGWEEDEEEEEQEDNTTTDIQQRKERNKISKNERKLRSGDEEPSNMKYEYEYTQQNRDKENVIIIIKTS